MKIETHLPRIRWSWASWMVLPWVTMHYSEMCSGAPLAFTMRKFIADPALIAFLSSLNVAFNFAVGAICNYMSDRIWTRWGRRRPFLVVGWAGVTVMLLLIPLAPNIWVLALLIVLFQFFQDVAKPYEPLYNEVIPPPQRGRTSTLRNISQNITSLVFNGVLIAQFDRDYGIDAFGRTLQVNGEKLLYWAGAAATLVTCLFIAFRVRETPPPGGAVLERFKVRSFIREVFGQREWWMVYLLYVCPILAGSCTQTFLPLLQTEQLGFTKPQVGWAMGIIMAANMVIFVPLSGYLADRMSRLRLYQIGLFGQVFVNFLFFLYMRFIADYVVPLPVMMGFLAFTNAFISCVYVLWGPLVFDYIPSNRFGTVSAGFSFIAGAAAFLLLNFVGLWIKGFTAVFGTAGGSSSDYSSMYILQLGSGALALFCCRYFTRQVEQGRIIAYGRLETSQAAATPSR